MNDANAESGILTRAADAMSRYVLPLYFDDRHDRPTQVGSAFFVRFGNADYLVTAAHVLDKRDEGDLYFYSAHKETVLVQGRACVSGKGLNRAEDQIDVAVVRLVQGTPRLPYVGLERLAFDIHELRPRLQNRAGRIFSVIGYPSTKNEFRRAHGEVRAQPYGFFGRSVDEAKYVELHLSPSDHLLIQFERRMSFNEGSEQVVFPKPQGMSGGPIWLFNSENSDEFRFGFPVVGIAVAHKERHALVQGTDIGIALQFIGKLHAKQ